MATELGKAYVQIVPSAQGISGSISGVLGDEATGAGKKAGLNIAGGIGTALKGATGIMAAGTAAVSAALIKGAGDVAEYGDNIDKMSQKMGMSAQAYQEWDAVMQHSGTSMETMKASMKTLANAAETGSDAFEKLGISQQELQELSQEQLFERTISALQNVEDETQRTYLAGKTLGRGATELGALLNTSAEDTQAMRDRVRELGGVMSDDAVKAAAVYQDSLQDMQTAISGVSRGIISDFLPSVTTIMDGITEVFGGDGGKGVELITQGVDSLLDTLNNAIPRVMEVGGKIMTSITSAIIENLPQIASQGTEIIVTLVSSVISSIPTLLTTGVSVVEAIVSSIASSLPMLAQSGVDMVNQLISTFDSSGPGFLSSALGMISNLVSGFLQGVPGAISTMGTLLQNLLQAVISALPSFLNEGAEIITNIILGIAGSIPSIISAALDVVLALLNTIVSNLPDIVDAGFKMLTSIVEGILEGLPDIVDSAVELVEEFLSKISDNLPQILSKGVEVIAHLVSGIIQSLPQVVASAASAAAQFIATIASNFPSILSKGIEIIGKLVSGILGAIPTVASAAGSAISEFLGKITGKLGEIVSKGREIITSLANGVKNNISKIVSTVTNIFSNFKSAIQGKDWGSIGSNIINGIKNGISNGIGRLKEAAQNAAKKAFEAAKSFLGIRSPSRLFRDKVGKMMAEGMAIGFENEVDPDDYEDAIEPLTGIGKDFSADVESATVTVDKDGENRDVVAAIEELRQAILGIQMVLDTGEIVGSIVDPLNRSFGRMAVIAERG